MVGVNVHSQDFTNHPASGFTSIGTAVSCTFAVGSKRLSQEWDNDGDEICADPKLQQARMLCEEFYKSFEDLLQPGVLPMDVLPNVEHCPPTLQYADKDVRFRQDPTGSNDCRLQVLPFEFATHSKLYSFVQQCCYDIGSGG